MSRLSRLLDKVSGRNGADVRPDENAPPGDSTSHGGEPHPNAQTTQTHDPGGAKA